MKTRKEIKYSKKDRLGSLSDNRPAGSAAAQFVHKAYKSYTVDEYVRKKEREAIGQESSK